MGGPVSRVAGARRYCCHYCRRNNEPVIIVEPGKGVKVGIQVSPSAPGPSRCFRSRMRMNRC